MRQIKTYTALICMAATVAFSASVNAGKEIKTPPAGKGFAVVELFTSEGCSSCPPADALVARIQKESAGKPIYILAFHVDYWNRLGWKDVFSNADYTARQRQYARWLKLSSVYTPQAIVNGSKEFVGSEESTLRNTLKSDLQNPAKTDLTLSDIKINNSRATLQYRIDGTVTGAALLVALIEKNASTKVTGGENGGRTLSHVQIVRQLQSINLGSKINGAADISLPAGFNPDGWEVIAFVQNTSSGEITCAANATFPSATSAKSK